MLSIMNTPNIATKDIGNGTSMEIVMLMPKDSPIQTNRLSRNGLLLLLPKLGKQPQTRLAHGATGVISSPS
jgi:hypothetical protein